jgi:hypothetical protein
VKVRWLIAPLAALLFLFLVTPLPVGACGGFFCTTIPVDQNAERIIFTMDEGSITTYVQISYTGRPQDFAWVLPVPSVPKVDTANSSIFTDLDRLTTPVYIPPQPPACLRRAMPVMAAPAGRAEAAKPADGSQTTVLASGEVGPFGYDVVTSPDPLDLVAWLRNNGYRITDEMIPLVRVYTDEGLVFLAMKLKPGQNTSDVTPVKLIYDASLVTIPLRLTAVAAQPDMPVIVWIFAKDQTQTLNYVPITVADSEVGFSPFGGNNYRQVTSQVVDQAGGRAFITELAEPTSALRPPADPAVTLLFQQYPFLTRHYTRISPEEMTSDPTFDVVPGLPNLSNVHDLSNKPAPWNCSDDFNTFKPVANSGPPPWMMAGGRYMSRFGQGGAPKAGLMFVIVALSLLAVFRPSFLRPRFVGSAAARTSRAWTRSVAVTGRAMAFGDLFWRAIGMGRLTRDAVALLFLEMMILQGVHEMEHIVQVVQRTILGIGNGAGMLGSVFDVEPVHMVYNVLFLILIGAVYAGCRRDRSVIPANPQAVMRLLQVSFVFQIWHSVEHVVKMYQYIETGLNGTPGILGYWIPVVFLHFGYNTLLYVPIVVAFFMGDFHKAAWRAVTHGRRGRVTRTQTAS